MDLDQLLDPRRLAEIWRTPSQRRRAGDAQRSEKSAEGATESAIGSRRPAADRSAAPTVDMTLESPSVDARIPTERIATERFADDAPTAIVPVAALRGDDRDSPVAPRLGPMPATPSNSNAQTGKSADEAAAQPAPADLIWPPLDTQAAYLAVQESLLALFASAPEQRELLRQELVPMAEALGLEPPPAPAPLADEAEADTESASGEAAAGNADESEAKAGPRAESENGPRNGLAAEPAGLAAADLDRLEELVEALLIAAEWPAGDAT